MSQALWYLLDEPNQVEFKIRMEGLPWEQCPVVSSVPDCLGSPHEYDAIAARLSRDANGAEVRWNLPGSYQGHCVIAREERDE